MTDQTQPPKPDVSALLAQVEAAVQAKKAAGFYDPAEIRRVEAAAVSYQRSAEDGAAAELTLWQKTLVELVNPTDWGVETHRGGAAGRLIVGVKKLVYKASKFCLNVWLATQVKYNAALVRLTGVLLPQHLDLRARMPQAEQRLELLEDICRDLAEGLSRTRNGLRDAENRLSGLDKTAARGREQVEPLLAELERLAQRLAQAGQVPAQTVGDLASLRRQSRDGAYLAFEELHRGRPEEIKARQMVYLPHFRDGVGPERPLLDIGCGRGEFLALAAEAGLAARGVDQNADSVATARAAGLDAVQADALEYLRGLPDQSLGGILMAQVVEHLTLDELMELLGLCVAKLAPGGALIAETINPQSLCTFASAFYLDLTHQKPIHPEALRFIWRWLGLSGVEVLYLSEIPADGKLELVVDDGQNLTGAFNRNIMRLNQLLYGPQDYAVLGRK